MTLFLKEASTPKVSATDSGPNTDTSVVKIAMLSKGSPLVQEIDLSCASEFRVPGSFPEPTIRGHTSAPITSLPTDHGDAVTSTLQDSSRIEHATEYFIPLAIQ